MAARAFSVTRTAKGSAANPFIAYRQHLDVYAVALHRGLSDEAYVSLVAEADEKVAAVDGTGFLTTPMVELALAGDLAGAGQVLAKVETGSVAGSHKARHLFGLLLHFLIDEATLKRGRGPQADLAIASCGNAALGAAVVAKAAQRPLRVFVPSSADPVILERLDELGATVTLCDRDPSTVGDPTVAALDDAVAGGAQPFTVQGSRCPEVIDGGRTLGLELADQLDEGGVEAASIYIQVGGGALATAVMDGLARAWPDRSLPRLHPVQAEAAHPYVAGWRRIAEMLFRDRDLTDPSHDWHRARILANRLDFSGITNILAAHAKLMTPWPDDPTSVASGILDDVTYDWPTLMAHQLATGGWPILVTETTFTEAMELVANEVSPPPDETGAAGLAGLIEHQKSSEIGDSVVGPVVVLLTGAAR